MGAIDEQEPARAEVVWTPDPDVAAGSQLAAFTRAAAERTGRTFGSYDDLLRWTIDEPGDFWQAFADWIGVRWHDRPTASLADASMPGAVWFPGGALNHAEHALAHGGDGIAIVSRSQSRPTVTLTWDELQDAVARCRAGLVRLGVGRGDRVAAYLPNVHETIVAFLATASLGAVWSSCAPEFGVRAVIDRWSQLAPTVLFAIDGYRYGTREIDRRSELAEIVSALPELRHVVLLPYLHTDEAVDVGALGVDTAPVRTRAAPPACRSRSCTATAGSPSSI